MKATSENPALGYLSPVERIYAQLLTDLRGAIEMRHRTLAAFVESQAARGEVFELRNLYRVLNPEHPQKLSLDLYVRLCAAIGVGGDRVRAQRTGPNNLSLLDYLFIDHDAILKSILELQYQGS